MKKIALFVGALFISIAFGLTGFAQEKSATPTEKPAPAVGQSVKMDKPEPAKKAKKTTKAKKAKKAKIVKKSKKVKAVTE